MEILFGNQNQVEKPFLVKEKLLTRTKGQGRRSTQKGRTSLKRTIKLAIWSLTQLRTFREYS
jgi:hypothetical protein